VVFYFIGEGSVSTQVQVNNQFGDDQTFDLIGPDLLAVPSEKLNFAEQLDHFKCYACGMNPLLDETVELRDQIVDLSATVDFAGDFCNPVEKQLIGPPVGPTPILHNDYHLTLYQITLLEPAIPRNWNAVVDNQFGEQALDVYGPVGLAVPTQKLVPGDHEPPVGLDHFLLYMASGSIPTVPDVALTDQFDTESSVTGVGPPIFFGIPVEKEDATGITPVSNPWSHLVFYAISDVPCVIEVQVRNQFNTGELQIFDLVYHDLLAVPSLKLSIEYEPF
jgi:hypothetical protein